MTGSGEFVPLAGEELRSACEVLFGWADDEASVRLPLLDGMQLDEIFRRRALATHPDRAFMLGLDESECVELFRETMAAYSTIRSFIDWRRTFTREPSSPYRHRDLCGDPWEGPEENYWRGQLPYRKLLFGQFLYYSGRVSSAELVDAVIWQWLQRPPFGKIACMWGYLTSGQVEGLLGGMELNERIGEAALRLGCLTSFRRNAVLGLQRMIQRPIGRYFVEKSIITSEQVRSSLRQFKDHNLTVCKIPVS